MGVAAKVRSKSVGTLVPSGLVTAQGTQFWLDLARKKPGPHASKYKNYLSKVSTDATPGLYLRSTVCMSTVTLRTSYDLSLH